MAKKDLKLGESSISVKRGRGSGTGETVSLKREAFNRKQFDDTVNTEFTELGQSNIERDLSFFDPSLATVSDFFTIYQSLFYQIPKEGEINSHIFLINESTNYTQYEAQREEIDALQEEIDALRAQNVQLVEDLTNTINALTNSIGNIDG
jgi:hypothetical protein